MLLLAVAVLAVGVLVARVIVDNSAQQSGSTSYAPVLSETVSPIARTTAGPAYETKVVYWRNLVATAEVIAQNLPTPTLISEIRPDWWEGVKQYFLMDIALQTAVAIYLPYTGYQPRPRHVPYELMPMPTEPPIPSIPTGSGRLYNVSLEDNPIGKHLIHVNHWGGDIDGHPMWVYAGAVYDNITQGLLLVVTPIEGDEYNRSNFDEYLAPADVGALRITDESGGILTLQAADSTVLHFDLRSPQWVSQPEQTPTPTIVARPAIPSSTFTGPELDATKNAWIIPDQQTRVALATQYALATPVPPTFVPIPTAVPYPSPELGIHSCGGADPEFNIGSCWTGQAEGGYISASTRQSVVEPSQVMLRVITSTFDQRTVSQEQLYPVPAQAGLLDIAYVDWPRMTLISNRESPTISISVFNLLTRQWEEPSTQCSLYPIALHTSVLSGGGAQERYLVRETTYGTRVGNFGWLSWDGSQGDEALATSLTLPGNSSNYVNPNDPTDHTVSVGDWVLGRPEVIGSQAVSDALGVQVASHYKFVVPVWDQAAGQNNTLRFQVSGFAWVYGIEEYSVEQPNHIALRYWGPAACPRSP